MTSAYIRRADRVFYTGMAAVMAAMVFVGFSRTFYLSAYFRGPALSPLRLVHGTLFTAWIVLFVTQTFLVASPRVQVHMRVGVAGALLAAAMVVVGTAMAISSVRDGFGGRDRLDPRVFLAIPLFDILVFGSLVAAGISFRRKPETHKRLMLLATLSLLAAAVARWPTDLAAMGPRFFFGVVDLLVVLGVIYDLVTRRRVHLAYVLGGGLLVASQPLRLALGGTQAWLAFADVIIGR